LEWPAISFRTSAEMSAFAKLLISVWRKLWNPRARNRRPLPRFCVPQGTRTPAECDQYLAIIERLPLPENGVQAFTIPSPLMGRSRRWKAGLHVQPHPFLPQAADVSRRAGVQVNARRGLRTQ